MGPRRGPGGARSAPRGAKTAPGGAQRRFRSDFSGHLGPAWRPRGPRDIQQAILGPSGVDCGPSGAAFFDASGRMFRKIGPKFSQPFSVAVSSHGDTIRKAKVKQQPSNSDTNAEQERSTHQATIARGRERPSNSCKQRRPGNASSMREQTSKASLR